MVGEGKEWGAEIDKEKAVRGAGRQFFIHAI